MRGRSCLVVRAPARARANLLTANNVKLSREDLFCKKGKIEVAPQLGAAIVEAWKGNSARPSQPLEERQSYGIQ